MTSLSDVSATEFLILYGFLLAMACVAALAIPARLRPPGRANPVEKAEELAWLAGGAPRVTDSVLAQLYSEGALHPEAKGRFRIEGRSLAGPGAAALQAEPGPLTVTGADRTLKPLVRAIADSLAQRDLALDAAESRRLRLAGVLPFLVLLLFGAYRLAAGEALGEPVALLAGMMVLAGVLALLRAGVLDKRTEAGRRALAKAQARAERLRLAPTRPEVALGVALFGTGVLVGTPFADLHALRREGGDGGSSGSESSGDGDGSGCGGCGG